MSEAQVNGVQLHYELHGSGDPLVLVHGSWTDATQWGFVVPHLAESFKVLVYDRRGHSRSEVPKTQGSIDEDGDDLAALMKALDIAPAHVVTNSSGGNVALRLALRRPELFSSLTCHEPPLWSLLGDDPEAQAMIQQGARSLESVGQRIAQGDHEGAARQFVDELAFGPGAWDNQLPHEVRAMFVRNAPTFLDELQDPTQLHIDDDVLKRLHVPIHLTMGSDSPPGFRHVIDRLVDLIPVATRETIEGTGHMPHLMSPDAYVSVLLRALEQAAA
jgi:pimeloyl-ACP methyl ester carboxylesterase